MGRAMKAACRRVHGEMAPPGNRLLSSRSWSHRGPAARPAIAAALRRNSTRVLVHLRHWVPALPLLLLLLLLWGGPVPPCTGIRPWWGQHAACRSPPGDNTHTAWRVQGHVPASPVCNIAPTPGASGPQRLAAEWEARHLLVTSRSSRAASHAHAALKPSVDGMLYGERVHHLFGLLCIRSQDLAHQVAHALVPAGWRQQPQQSAGSHQAVRLQGQQQQAAA
jgi:hypothetical protein